MRSKTTTSKPRDEDEATRAERLGEEAEARLYALLHDVQQPPPIPSDVHEFGAVIEFTKNMLTLISDQIGSLKEMAAQIRELYTQNVRGEKATLNDKDKREIARLCAEDATLRDLESNIKQLTAAWATWDARRSRLNRDYEISKIDYAREQARAATADALDELSRKLRSAADYFANKVRGAL